MTKNFVCPEDVGLVYFEGHGHHVLSLCATATELLLKTTAMLRVSGNGSPLSGESVLTLGAGTFRFSRATSSGPWSVDAIPLHEFPARLQPVAKARSRGRP
jgi:hypothetical protein